MIFIIPNSWTFFKMYIFREREREREYNLQQQKPKLLIFSIKTHFWNYPKHVVFLGFTKHLVNC
jgi:hypothetical protein